MTHANRILGKVAMSCVALLCATVAHANQYREKGKSVTIVQPAMTVAPPRDWNRLGIKPGKFAETWTLDGEQLNEVMFYVGVEPGQPLIRELSKKREPLPKLSSNTLLVDLPGLLEGTYRAYRKIGNFIVTSVEPERFLSRDGVHFTYEFTDQDNLPRKGDARAILLSKKLYMMTFDAPRLHYFDRTLGDFRALANATTLAQ